MATIRPFSDALLELSTDGLTWIDVTPFGIGLGTVRLAQAIPLVDFGRGSRQVAQRKSPKQAYSLPFSLEVNETTLPWLHLGHGAQRYVRWSSEGNGTGKPRVVFSGPLERRAINFEENGVWVADVTVHDNNSFVRDTY